MDGTGPVGEGGYGSIETRWMVGEICLFVSNEPLIKVENGGLVPGFLAFTNILKMRGG